MLGEFEMMENEAVETFEFSYQITLWCIFIGATFLTNVVFFNTLVSVIGENYGELWNLRHRYGTVQQTKLMGDYIYQLAPKLPKERFLYVLVPVEDDEKAED